MGMCNQLINNLEVDHQKNSKLSMELLLTFTKPENKYT